MSRRRRLYRRIRSPQAAFIAVSCLLILSGIIGLNQENRPANRQTDSYIQNDDISKYTDPGLKNPVNNQGPADVSDSTSDSEVQIHGEIIPDWDGENAYTAVNDNTPFFTDRQKGTVKSYEKYSSLDDLGRCGTAIACIGTDLIPDKQRGYIGDVKPTGWHTVKYAGIDGNYLYNRCHLIGYQLTGENSNEKNLITGTRYLNIDGMLPFENKTADYLHDNPNNHVLYRVAPYFSGDNLLAKGVLMEGYSIEDKGAGINFCVFCYNVQPGVDIDYADGSSDGPEYTGSDSKTSVKTSDNDKVRDIIGDMIIKAEKYINR